MQRTLACLLAILGHWLSRCNSLNLTSPSKEIDLLRIPQLPLNATSSSSSTNTNSDNNNNNKLYENVNNPARIQFTARYSIQQFPVFVYDPEQGTSASSSAPSSSIAPDDKTNPQPEDKDQFNKRQGSNEWKVSEVRKGRNLNGNQSWRMRGADKAKNQAYSRLLQNLLTEKHQQSQQQQQGSASVKDTQREASTVSEKISLPASNNSVHRYNDLTPQAASNNYDVPAAPPATSNNYEYNTPENDTPKSSYGYRNREKEPEYNGPQNYDDYQDGYNNQPQSDGYSDSYDSQYPSTTDDYSRPQTGGGASGGSSLPPSKYNSVDNYEREVKPQYQSRPTYNPRPSYNGGGNSKPIYSRPTRYRGGYPYLTTNSFGDLSEWDSPSEKSWLSSLFGGYKYKTYRNRNPFGVTSTEAIPLSALPPAFFESQYDSLGLLGNSLSAPSFTAAVAPMRSPSWFNFVRPLASSVRPSYSFGGLRSLYSYAPRLPQSPPMPPPVHGPLHSPMPMSHGPPPPPPGALPFYTYGNLASASSYMPVAVRPMTYGPPMMQSPSTTSAIKVPFPHFGHPPPPPPPHMMRPPVYSFPFKPLFPDMNFMDAFKTNASDPMEAAASRNPVSFLLPPLKATKRTDKAVQEKPTLVNSEPGINASPNLVSNLASSSVKSSKEPINYFDNSVSKVTGLVNKYSSSISTSSSSSSSSRFPQLSPIIPRSMSSNLNATAPSWMPVSNSRPKRSTFFN